MKIRQFIAAAIVFGTVSAATWAGPKVREHVYEAVGSQITLPGSATGELTFQACQSCRVIRLQANASTRYFLGKWEVSLAELRAYLSKNPDTFVGVMRHRDSFTLSRVVVSTPNDVR